jgi:hypothetical protein
MAQTKEKSKFIYKILCGPTTPSSIKIGQIILALPYAERLTEWK